MDEHTALIVFASLWHNEENTDHMLNRKSKLLNFCEHPVEIIFPSYIKIYIFSPIIYINMHGPDLHDIVYMT